MYNVYKYIHNLIVSNSLKCWVPGDFCGYFKLRKSQLIKKKSVDLICFQLSFKFNKTFPKVLLMLP